MNISDVVAVAALNLRNATRHGGCLTASSVSVIVNELLEASEEIHRLEQALQALDHPTFRPGMGAAAARHAQSPRA